MAIISFKHNFIFIKTNKTAGTSIEVDLSRIAGDDAIVTPIFPPEPGHSPRNFEDKNGEPLYYNHMPARLIRQRLGAKRFNAMFKFCVEREPVEKCISQYHMLRNSEAHNAEEPYTLSWDEFVKAEKFPVNTGKFAINKVKVVDRILRYDTLPGSLERLMNNLGVVGFTLTSKAKSTYSKKVLVKPEDVTAEQRAIIERRFKQSVKLSGINWSKPPKSVGRNKTA
ncbi:hypothetical protein [Shimia sp. MIT1388]|uniref:hypothetical protein n=1 Tax=Shimia sp. MIT1388 TaxID=3096992 RepID=UPI00399B303B